MSDVTFSTAPIGLFDSGVGGTTIWKEINALMPNESTLFLAEIRMLLMEKKLRKKS